MSKSCKHIWVILTYEYDWRVKECRKCYEIEEIHDK
jgi:hypothetical protein